MVNAQNLLRSPEYLNRLSVTTGGASFSIDLSLSAGGRDCKGGGVYMSLRRPGAYSGRLPAGKVGRAASDASSEQHGVSDASRPGWGVRLRDEDFYKYYSTKYPKRSRSR